MLELGETIVSCADVSVFYGDTCAINNISIDIEKQQLLPLSVRQGAGNQHFCEPLIA